jgi:hypothetical protein
VRYLVRCLRCDRAFWQAERDAPVPVHTSWDRRRVGSGHSKGRCSGSERPGYWIAEGEGPLTDWPRG